MISGFSSSKFARCHSHPSPTSTSSLSSIFKVAKSTFASYAGASSTRNEKINAVRIFRMTKVTGPTAGIITNRSTKLRFLFSIQEVMEVHDALDFMTFLYAEPLSQIMRANASLTRELPTSYMRSDRNNT